MLRVIGIADVTFLEHLPNMTKVGLHPTRLRSSTLEKEAWSELVQFRRHVLSPLLET
jgi:hypothetical protein